jgi:hypothetical protein
VTSNNARVPSNPFVASFAASVGNGSTLDFAHMTEFGGSVENLFKT